MKVAIGGLLAILGFIGMILSAYAIQFAGAAFFLTLIIWLFDIIVISGWWVIGAPILMFVGGFIGAILNMIVAAIGAAIADS